MNKKIVIEIDSTGDVSIDAMGFKGKSCKEATKAIEDALGGGETVYKPEYRMFDTELTRQKVMR